VFLGLSAIALLALMVLPMVPYYAEASAPLLLALLRLFPFQATKMSLYSYLFGLGRSLDISTGFLSTVVGASAWHGCLRLVAVVAIGLRYGRDRPLAAMVAAAVIAYMAVLFFGEICAVFAIAEIIVAMIWAFVAPHLFGMCSAFDSKGQMGAWSSFFSKLGTATGPVIGGIVLSETHYERLI